MAIIPVERRFTSGISTLKWHTRWSKDEKGADDGDDETGDEAKNWASGFIVFKVKLFLDFSPEVSFFKDSPDPSHFIFEINVGKRRIRHRATLNLNNEFLNTVKID